MPERSCHGCVKQKEWGCTATRSEVPKGTTGAVPGPNWRWWSWTNPAALPLTFDGEETYACPRQTLNEDRSAWNRTFLFYGMFKAGHLPQAGAVMDQANKALEVFRIIDDVNAECDAALMNPGASQAPIEKRKKGRPGHG